MKKIFAIMILMITSIPAFGAIDTWFNTNPYQEYDKSIELKKVFSDVYDKDGILSGSLRSCAGADDQ